MADRSKDTSGIRFPPPLIYLGVFLAGYALDRVAPMRVWAAPGPLVLAISWALILGAIFVAASAWVQFRRAGTTPNPTQPTTALVVRGPYRFTRNPMYLGLAALYLGAALRLNSLWPLVLFPVVITLIEWRVIAREEAYLEAKFGEAYRAYKARVRRWI
ncbi:MAG TPA: isoprenylcysteine carboxylmethyltransferase family protein [Gemmatimonadales bacterium]|jgi:protein-S-isoprenylcysteine O-methyltransferase Ste14|nr:isoprenylcysteine carboxylmethyltransferase family protein [Gemmatimonadales bacterium]